jgi:hypothetical protein
MLWYGMISAVSLPRCLCAAVNVKERGFFEGQPSDKKENRSAGDDTAADRKNKAGIKTDPEVPWGL